MKQVTLLIKGNNKYTIVLIDTTKSKVIMDFGFFENYKQAVKHGEQLALNNNTILTQQKRTI